MNIADITADSAVLYLRRPAQDGMAAQIGCRDCNAWCYEQEKIRHSKRCDTASAQPVYGSVAAPVDAGRSSSRAGTAPVAAPIRVKVNGDLHRYTAAEMEERQIRAGARYLRAVESGRSAAVLRELLVEVLQCGYLLAEPGKIHESRSLKNRAEAEAASRHP